LVQSEKMNALGTLTNHVAEDVEEPLNLISNGTQIMRELGADIMTIWNSYEGLRKAKTPQEVEMAKHFLIDIETSLNSTEVKDDFIQTLKDMEDGSSAVLKTVKSLLSLSRAHQDEFNLVDVDEGLDAVADILKNDTKHRIEVVKNYDPHVSEVRCIFVQVNQVFLNLM
jgi:two-component system NtrC family sensor kinase